MSTSTPPSDAPQEYADPAEQTPDPMSIDPMKIVQRLSSRLAQVTMDLEIQSQGVENLTAENERLKKVIEELQK